jgi:hypothetical protein
MTTPQAKGQTKEARWYNDKTLFWYGFFHSNYITAAWNWFMELAGKAAEPVLFATVIYSGYELLPGVPQPGPGVDALVFICQMITLDIGGLGLLKIAKNNNLDGRSLPACVGYALLALMIANVSLATLERILHIPPTWRNGIEGTLLLARAIMAVLYGHAIHALKKDGSQESTQVVKASTVAQRIVDLETNFTEQIRHITESHNEHMKRMTDMLAQATEKTERQISSVEEKLTKHFTEQMDVSSDQYRTFSVNTTERFHSDISTHLQPIVEMLEQHKATLTRIEKELKDRTPNTEKRMPTSTVTNIRQFAPKSEHRTAPNTEFDKGAFVRSCLTEIPNIRNADIQHRAEEIGQTISPAYISEVRKAFESQPGTKEAQL